MNKKEKAHRRIRKRKCTGCDLHAYPQTVCLLGTGNLNAELAVIGEAPGNNEDRKGKPFVGRSGQLLMDVLNSLGFYRQDLFISNVVHCHPENNKTPTTKQINACVHYLQKELDVVKPKVILTLGNTALKAITKRSGVTKYAGRMLEYQGNGWKAKVIPSVHPAACLRNPKYDEMFVDALNRMAACVHGVIKKDKIRWKNLNTIAKVKKAIHAIQAKGSCAFDVETTSLYWWKDDFKLVTLGFSWCKGKGAVIPLYHDDSPYTSMQIRRILKLIDKGIFNNKKITKIAHNTKFDMNSLRKYGVHTVGPIHDTILAHHVLNENARHDLDTLSLMYTNHGEYWKDVVALGLHQGKASEIPIKKLGKYNAIDCEVTWRLHHKFKKELKADYRLNRLYHKLYIPAIHSFSEIEWNGMLVDTVFLRKLQNKAEKEIQKRYDALMQFKQCRQYQHMRRKVDKKFIVNFKSHQQVKDILFFEKCGFKYKIKDWYRDRDDFDKVSSKEEVLVDLSMRKRHAEFPIALVEYRKVMKLYGTYIKGMWQWLDKDDYIHPNFKLHGTVTGRPSCSDPNLQNIPRPDEGDYDSPLKHLIKKMFIAPKGYTLVELDYSQMELRVMAAESGDVRMIRWFKKGVDIHAATAAEVNSKKLKDVTTDERYRSKRVNFGVIYLISGMGLAKQMSSPKKGIVYNADEGDTFIEQFFEKFPAVKAKMEQYKDMATANGFVVTLFGQKRRLPDIQSDSFGVQQSALRQAVNAPIQGTAVGFTILSMNIVTGNIGRKRHIPSHTKLVNMVHDSLLFYVPKEKAKGFCRRMILIMQKPPTLKYFEFILSVPLVVDAKSGRNWAKTKELKVAA